MNFGPQNSVQLILSSETRTSGGDLSVAKTYATIPRLADRRTNTENTTIGYIHTGGGTLLPPA